MTPDYDFEKLAREIVASRLKDLEKAPQAAGEIAKKILVSAIVSTKARQDPHLTVRGVCRGVMGGLMVIEKDLPDAAVAILKEMSNVALEVHLDPTEMMTWGMEGIAEVAHLAGPEARNNVQEKIEEAFMGTGEVFSALCDKAKTA